MRGRYGHEFIEHTYLYHTTRQDHRHNFSPHFYYYYLSSNVNVLSLSPLMEKVLLNVPQLGVVTVLGFWGVKYGLVTAVFLQTFAFVAFNKVITSQVINFLIVRCELIFSILCGIYVFCQWCCMNIGCLVCIRGNVY